MKRLLGSLGVLCLIILHSSFKIIKVDLNRYSKYVNTYRILPEFNSIIFKSKMVGTFEFFAIYNLDNKSAYIFRRDRAIWAPDYIPNWFLNRDSDIDFINCFFYDNLYIKDRNELPINEILEVVIDFIGFKFYGLTPIEPYILKNLKYKSPYIDPYLKSKDGIDYIFNGKSAIFIVNVRGRFDARTLQFNSSFKYVKVGVRFFVCFECDLD